MSVKSILRSFGTSACLRTCAAGFCEDFYLSSSRSIVKVPNMLKICVDIIKGILCIIQAFVRGGQKEISRRILAFSAREGGGTSTTRHK